MSFDLNGKTAIVTGAARGIGLAISRRFTELGAKVSGWDLSSVVAKDEDCFLHLVDVDVASEASVKAGFAASQRALRRVDILVANAGINGPTKPAWDYTLSEWQQVIDVDLTGVFLSTRAVLPQMRARGTGRIIVTSSVAGKEGNPGACAYGAAKSGVIGYVKGLAREFNGESGSTGDRVGGGRFGALAKGFVAGCAGIDRCRRIPVLHGEFLCGQLGLGQPNGGFPRRSLVRP